MSKIIESIYVEDFELIKWLKEKGFVAKPNHVKFDTDYVVGYIECENGLALTEFQFEAYVCEHLYLRPEIWQVVEFLMVNYNIFVSVNISTIDTWYFELYNLRDKRNAEIPTEYETTKYINKSPKEAYLSAFNYIKNNNLLTI